MPLDNRSLSEVLLWAGAAGTVAAAICSSLFLALNGWRERVAAAKRHATDVKAADLRHFRELALEAAIAEWKEVIEECKTWTPKHGEEDRPVPDPFDYFVLKKLKMMQTFGDMSISVDDLPMKWKEMAEFHAFLDNPGKKKRSETP